MTTLSARRPPAVRELVTYPDTILTVPITTAEQAVLDQLGQIVGASHVNVVRLALFAYCRHAGLDVPIATFGVLREV